MEQNLQKYLVKIYLLSLTEYVWESQNNVLWDTL